jgi:hypothetical protein
MKAIYFLSLMLLALTVHADPSTKKGSITLTILAQGSKKPIPFANVIILHDGEMIAGKAANRNGKVLMNDLNEGQYTIQISSVGMKAKYIDQVWVKEGFITTIPIGESLLTTTKENDKSIQYAPPTFMHSYIPTNGIQLPIEVEPFSLFNDNYFIIYFYGCGFRRCCLPIEQVSVLTEGLPAQYENLENLNGFF